MTITALPTPPSRDDPANFADEADAFLGALPTFGTEANALAVELNTLAAGLDAIAAGGAMSIPYTFSTTTTDSDPGAGILRLNNATQNAATVIRADLLGADGSTWTSVLDTFDDSTNTVKGHIRLIDSANATKFLIFSVSALASPSGYKNITVANVASSAASPFADGASLIMYFSRAGDVGPTGATGVGGGLIFLSSIVASGGPSTVSLETTFDSSYDQYLIVVDNLTPGTNGVDLHCQLKVGGTYQTNYYWHNTRTHSSSNAYVGEGYDASSRIVLANSLSNAASAQSGFQVYIHAPSSTAKKKIINWCGVAMSSIGGQVAMANGAAMHDGTAALTGVRFQMSSGTITSGTFSLFGIKPAS